MTSVITNFLLLQTIKYRHPHRRFKTRVCDISASLRNPFNNNNRCCKTETLNIVSYFSKMFDTVPIVVYTMFRNKWFLLCVKCSQFIFVWFKIALKTISRALFCPTPPSIKYLCFIDPQPLRVAKTWALS